MEKSNIDVAVVAVGYNRPDSLKTLLNSINLVKNVDNNLDLIISIDKGQRQKEIVEISEKFEWKYGKKIIRAFKERQGLRNHIIQCGDLTEKYDAVIVLEDDLIVSPYFYSYVKQALEFYKHEDCIAGISLYKNQINQGVGRQFEVEHNGYDAYMMQYAQSWGQCWTKKMWSEFKNWYLKNENKDLSEGEILPAYISSWDNHSWLKYYMRYIVERNKYFIYPIISLSSNRSEAGQHCRFANNDYYVSMLQGDMKFNFPRIDESVKYDIFFERVGIENKIFPECKGDILLDLYGSRTNYKNKRYVVSTNALPYKKINSFGLVLRPIEQNCIFPQPGEGINLYDLSKEDRIEKINQDYLTSFDTRGIHWKRLLHLGFSGFKNAILYRIKRK
ncbi:glycosyltransferase family 2 protein [Clostridium perfringens]|uniref:glycosyltransferase family A protein n=1 Tax=Clostridium perfringens TaxID=1502 RepID=UPI0022467B98|nr:glycosyltransferase family A protein [Clostridium perfringens]MCX0373504.1 glycosyltransferase family 2 protein [Clostridium perfringens]